MLWFTVVRNRASYLYYHGYDTYQREQDIRSMYENPAESAELYEKYGVDYIYIGPYERSAYPLSHIDFDHLELIFANRTSAIYKYR